MRLGGHRFRTAMVLLGAGLLATAPGGTAFPEENRPWNVEGKLLGKPKGPGLQDGKNPDSKKAEDVSGIACSTGTGFPRLCLAVDDESQGAQIVILEEGRLIAGDFVRLIDDTFEEKPLELDAEAVAFADGSFYVMGSHGRPRKEAEDSKEAKNLARAKASRHLFEVRLPEGSVDLGTGRRNADPSIRQSDRLADLLRGHPAIGRFVDAALADNGLTIEGVAVRDGILFAGLRGPVLEAGASLGDGKTLEHPAAAILVSPIERLFEDGTAEVLLLAVDLGKDTRGAARGVRDMVAYGDGVLILAGPVQDPVGDAVADGDYAIHLLDRPAAGTVAEPASLRHLHDLQGFGAKVKPEALLPLDIEEETLRVLVLFDGPGEGEPRLFRIDPR